MEVVLLLVGILGVALIVVPRMRGRRSGARRPAPSRRRVRARKAAVQAAAATSPVATWTPAEAAASRSGDWEVWDDELGWEGVEAAPAPAATPAPEPEPAPAAEADVAPPREPDREAWERWRASELSDSGPRRTEEPVAGGELPSVERWRERQANPPGEWDDDDGLGWESAAEPAETVALQRDDSTPARPARGADRTWSFAGKDAPTRDFSRNGNGNGSPRVELPRLEPPARASVTAPEAEPVPPAAVAGREWLTDTAWEAQPAPATQTDGASNGGGNGHVIAPAAAPRRGRRRLSPVLLVAIYAAAGIGVVILASTLLLGGSSHPKKSQAVTAPQPKASATVQATPGSATDDAVPAATPDPAVAEAARKAKAAARSFRRHRTAAARREHGAVADARKAYRRQHARRPVRAPVVQPPAYTPPPPATSTPVSPPSYTPPAAPRPSNRCEFCIG